MVGADGNTRKRSHSPPTSPPQSTSSTSSVQFTFINQHSDIRSIRERRIKNDTHRHEIRSHVMRGVRLTEHNEGKRRPTGRPTARTKSSDRKASNAGSSTTRSSPTSPNDCSEEEVVLKRESPTREGLTTADVNMFMWTNPYHTPPLYIVPSGNFFLNPFASTSWNTLSATATDNLLLYSFKVFFPVAFPVESTQTNEALARRSLVLHAQGSPVTFSAFLATFAYHRAVMYKHVSDGDYKQAHRDARMAISDKLEKGETDHDFLEGCFGLISTTTIAGNFTEARTHIDGLQRAMDLNGVNVPDAAKAWLPVADIKAALGMLDRPRLPLPWPRITYDRAAIQRLLPPESSQLSRMAYDFEGVAELSPPLRELLRDASVVCHMCDFNARDVQGLTEQEHVAFRCKSNEVEHDLLKYVFDHFPNKNQDRETLIIPATEDLVRLGVLGLLSTISVHVLPGCGLGRAITQNQMAAVHRWFAQVANAPKQTRIDVPMLKAVTWALFVFVHCAKEQVEAYEFKMMLLETTQRLWLMNWDEVETTIYGFLYVPSVMAPEWRRIWEDVENWKRKHSEDPRQVERAPGRR